MGTNYIRIPKSDDVRVKYLSLVDRISRLDIWSINEIHRGFNTVQKDSDSWDNLTPWDEFMSDMKVHLGKRSSGWKFCWNFHNGKYYSNKEELLVFIRSGRVVNEYGELQDTEEFIKMALEWELDGCILNEEYENEIRKKNPGAFIWGERYHDKLIDGLRVSQSTEFS